jgi:hypothetical protein
MHTYTNAHFYQHTVLSIDINNIHIFDQLTAKNFQIKFYN